MRFDLLVEDGSDSLKNVDTNPLKDKTILITGASGILGTHFVYGIVGRATEKNLQVSIHGVVGRNVPRHLSHLCDGKKVSFHEGNLTDPAFMRQLPNADIIIHAATYGQPQLFMGKSIETIKLNTTSLLSLFEKLNKGGKLLFVSSSEVYSGLPTPPFTENQIGTTNTTHPRSCYIEAKRCGEAICNAFRAEGVDCKSVRLALAYGPGTRPGDKRVLYSIIEKGLREKSIRLLDKGEAKRTYCYISDAIGMMWQILLKGKEPIYNVGGESTTTIAKLAEMVGAYLNVSVQLGNSGLETMAGAPVDVKLDLSRFKNEFGTPDFTGFDRGLTRTIQWQQSMQARETETR